MRQAVTTFNHISVSPRSASDELAQTGKLLMAEVTIFVRHDDRMHGIVRPYICRFWYDATSSIWHPDNMIALQNKHEDFDIGIIF